MRRSIRRCPGSWEGGTRSDEMGKGVGDERRLEPSEVRGRMREADRGVGEKTETLRRAGDSAPLLCVRSS